MKSPGDILAAIDKTLIAKYGFTDMQISLSESQEAVSNHSNESHALAVNQSAESDVLPVEERFYMNAHLALQIRLYRDRGKTYTAIISGSPEFREAGEMWSKLAKEMIPNLSIRFEP